MELAALERITGYYYNPNFLSFNATPYYNQARDNSTSNSLSDSSGIDQPGPAFQWQPFSGIDQLFQVL